MARSTSPKPPTSASPKPTSSRRPPRPPRARLEVDERRAQLLALGLSLFSERSYDEVSIDELARAAGVSKGLLYHYFPTKRDLYVAALRQAATQLLDETETDKTKPAEARARLGLDTYLDFVERHGPAYVALMRGGIGSDPEVATILEDARKTFAARILEDLPRELAKPLLRTAMRGWIGFVEATSLDWFAHRPVPRGELVELLLGMLVDTASRATGVQIPDLRAAAPMKTPGAKKMRKKK